MARFFVDRPVFAWVIAILIMLAGLLSMLTLPVSQYPSIAPPSISITATYPGASARSIEDSVTQIIEREMKGIDNLIYLSSSSESTGKEPIPISAASAGILRRPLRFGLIYLLLLAGVGGLYLTTPTGFLPDEDQGQIYALIMTPPGSTREQTLEVLKQVERHFLENEPDAVDALVTVAGFNFAGTGQNTGLGFIRLRDWSERQTPDLWANAVAGRAMAAFSQIEEARVLAFGPPAVAEMGNATGFDVYLKDVGANGHDALLAARNQLLGMAAQDPSLQAVRPNGLEPAPILSVDIDREKARAFGLDLASVNATLSAAWGSAYVDDFIHKGNVKKVYLQGDAEHRMVPADLEKWTLRNDQGDMVLFSAIANADWGLASPKLERYNGASAVEILGESAPGLTTGQAMIAMESLAERLPAGFELDWTGLSYEERAAGQQALLLYALSLLVVFLCLAALYESWSVPFSVMLVVPLGVLGTLVAASLRGMPNDVYFQVGLLTIIGLRRPGWYGSPRKHASALASIGLTIPCKPCWRPPGPIGGRRPRMRTRSDW